MKLSRKILNSMIRKELKNLSENQELEISGDLERIKDRIDVNQIDQLIKDKINTKNEFLELISLMIEMSPLKASEELISLKQAVQNHMKDQTQQGTQ